MTHDLIPANDLDPSRCRFMFGSAAADDVLREWLAADMRAARMSAAFRVYYRVRSLLPLGVRQLLQRRRRVVAAPDWYFPHGCIRALVDCIAKSSGCLNAIHPWPDGAQMACVLTHDVETEDGLRNIDQIARLEEQFGLRSSWNIVPHKYPLDWGLLRDLRERGFELGVHGFNHDGKLFTSHAVFSQRVPAIHAALEAFEAVGFRAPMVHRNLRWQQALAIDYDASCFDCDPFQPMPGGVGGVWPFMAGRFVELPYTLPQDHTLFIALGERDGRIWSKKLAYVAKLHGMALLITHPDYLDSPRRIDIYRRFLGEISEQAGAWHALPRDVAAWWRMRDASSLVRPPIGGWCICGPAADRARMMQIHVNCDVGESTICFSTPAEATVGALLLKGSAHELARASCGSPEAVCDT